MIICGDVFIIVDGKIIPITGMHSTYEQVTSEADMPHTNEGEASPQRVASHFDVVVKERVVLATSNVH